MSEWTPPERIAICQNPDGEGPWWDADPGVMPPGCIMAGCDCTPVPYVPESAPDALREENERLTRERDRLRELLILGESTLVALREENERLTRERDEDHRSMVDAWTERDALRARVEELERRDGLLAEVVTALCQNIEDYGPENLQAVAADARATLALLSGGSQEPRPVATCECCENPTTRPYVHPVEGIDLCAPCVAALPREEPPPDRGDEDVNVPNPLDRPVRWGKSMEDWAPPFAVLAALDDDARDEMAQRCADTIADFTFRGQPDEHVVLARAVVAAICGGRDA